MGACLFRLVALMSDLPTLMPPNIGTVERDYEQVFVRLDGLSTPVSALWDPDLCPLNLLPYLAWAFSVEEWDTNLSEDAKRASIKDSVGIHRRKGTIGAVKAALKSAGYGDAEVVERYGWDFHDGTATHNGTVSYAPPDHWAEYRIKLARPITVEQATQVRAILRDVAPIRSHLKALDFTEALNTYNGAITHDAAFTHGVA